MVKIFSYTFTFSYSELLSLTAHCSIKVNIKTFFYSQRLFCLRSLLSSLSSPFLFDLGLSRYSETLSPLSDSLSLFDLGLALPNAEMVAQQGMVAFCVGTSCRNSWVLVVWFQWVSPVSFLLSFSFTGLLSFTFFFHPKRKTLRFWVWV